MYVLLACTSIEISTKTHEIWHHFRIVLFATHCRRCGLELDVCPKRRAGESGWHSLLARVGRVAVGRTCCGAAQECSDEDANVASGRSLNHGRFALESGMLAKIPVGQINHPFLQSTA